MTMRETRLDLEMRARCGRCRQPRPRPGRRGARGPGRPRSAFFCSIGCYSPQSGRTEPTLHITEPAQVGRCRAHAAPLGAVYDARGNDKRIGARAGEMHSPFSLRRDHWCAWRVSARPTCAMPRPASSAREEAARRRALRQPREEGVDARHRGIDLPRAVARAVIGLAHHGVLVTAMGGQTHDPVSSRPATWDP